MRPLALAALLGTLVVPASLNAPPFPHPAPALRAATTAGPPAPPTAVDTLPGDTVRLATGLVSGAADAGDPEVRVYRGIPFAAPPVGPRRWAPPAPPESWDGVRRATEFSPACVQPLPRSRLPWTEPYMHQGDASEDCLYLNVWTAAAPSGERRPVLVYIHGGGFNEGSGSVALYDGASLAGKGLVVVTVNYRLGLLGFLAHPDLTAESPHHASGNYGLLDQVAALRWVRENIGAFGGDPGNVTIAGQSAGAMSVYLLMASPRAAGLFQRAIVQSGPGGLASFGMASAASLAAPLEEAEAAGRRFAEARGAGSVDELRSLSVAELTAAAPAGTPPPRFGPAVDGWFLPADVATVNSRGEENDVPLLTGFNADEGSAFPGYGESTPEALRAMAGQRFGDGDRFLELYPASTAEEAGEASKVAMRDLAAVALTRLVAERAETATSPAWLYYFERGIPWPEHPEYGAFHSGELPYVFDNLDRLQRPWEAVDRKLADVASSYWVRFATTGDPNAPGLPDWPAFEDAPGSFMVLGEEIGPRRIPADPDRRAFFERVVGAPSAAPASGSPGASSTAAPAGRAEVAAPGLAAMAIGPGHLEPAFDPAVTAYATRLDPAVTRLVVWTEPAIEGAAVTVNGGPATEPATVVALDGAATEVRIDVVAPSGESRRYTLGVTRRAPDDYPAVALDYVAGAMNEATIEHDGLTRRFLYYVPAGFDPGVRHAVIVGLHGFNHPVDNLANQTYGSMHALADRDGTLLLFPESTGSLEDETYSWNPLYAAPMPIYDGLSQVDDVGYITTLIDLFIGELNGDPDRVYVTGTSMGGAMTYALGAHVPGKLAAIAPVIMQTGTLYDRFFQDAAPIPAMIITGTGDPLVSAGGMPDNDNVPNLSQAANVDYWRERNGVDGTGEHASLPNPVGERFQGHTVDSHIERYEWDADEPWEADLVYVSVVNGGHWLPIASDRSLDPTADLGGFDGTYLGVWNMDWDGAAAIYEWFMERRR